MAAKQWLTAWLEGRKQRKAQAANLKKLEEDKNKGAMDEVLSKDFEDILNNRKP